MLALRFDGIRRGGDIYEQIKKIAKKFVTKYGAAIASCAFAFVAVAANTSCGLPFYEPEEPDGLEAFKKFNR